MYKILLAGAVVSTLMLVQAGAEDKAVSNENTSNETADNTPNETAQAPTIENEQLKAAYELAKKDFAAHQDASSLVKTNVGELPLVPEEKNIEDFPAALTAEESDPETIGSYYEAVADAYAVESERVQEAMLRAHQAAEKHKLDHQLKDMRHQDRHLPDDITQHTAGHTRDDATVPYRSAKYTPLGIHKDNDVLQTKRYNELKTEHDRLVMKHDFYEEIADFLEKPVAPVAEATTEQKS